jgi:hypothetical protein
MYATTKNLIKEDQGSIRKAVLKRFSPIEGVGIDLSQATNYQEALKVSGLGFTPVQEQLVTAGGVIVKGHKALYNSITNEQLSVVKKEYMVLTNEEAFQTAEDLVNYEGFKYEASNMQKGGTRSRLILSGPNAFIAGEEYTPFAVFNNSFDATKSVCIQFMFMRLACLNGMMRKAQQCNSTISLAHFGQKEAKLKALTQFRHSFAATMRYLQKEAEALQITPLTREEFKNEIATFAANYTFKRTLAQKLTSTQTARNEAFILSALQAYDAIDTANYDGTAFKAQLAFADVDSHMAPFVNRGRADIYLDRILQSDTTLSAANAVTNYILKSRNIIL